MVVLVIGAVYTCQQTSAKERQPRAGIVLDRMGRPELVTVACPGAYVDSVRVLAPADGSPNRMIVWAVELEDRTAGRASIPRLGPVGGYRFTDSTGNRPSSGDPKIFAGGPHELHVQVKGSNTRYSEVVVHVSAADLRHDKVLAAAGGAPESSYVPRDALAESLPDC